MHREPRDSSRVAALIGGGSLIAATLLFTAVFVYLARRFGYPEVLELPAAGVSASLLGGLAMLRNATSWVKPIAALNNVVLPIWMLVLGVVLLRHRTSASVPVPALTPSRR